MRTLKMTCLDQLSNLWLPLSSFLYAYDSKRLKEYTLGDFYHILKEIENFEDAYYSEIRSLEKFLSPKDIQSLEHLVEFLGSLKGWIRGIDKLDYINYEKLLSSLPMKLIRELSEGLRGDTELRVSKGVKFEDFSPKIRKYQKLFKELRKANECCI